MNCKICGKEATVYLNYPRMRLCKEHFIAYFERKIERTIKKYKMVSPEENILIAFSGGKDSAAVAHVFKKLGYSITGLHINLGKGEYSNKSEEYAKKQSKQIGLRLKVVDLRKILGKGVGEAKGSRPTCSVCGTTKRYILNRFAYEKGFDVVATGHNLDDETAFVFSNLLHWNTEYLAKQGPYLPGENKFVKKIKPLYETMEYEISEYVKNLGYTYITGKCPLSSGATILKYKKILDEMEQKGPGTKINFIKGFLKKKHLFEVEIQRSSPKECNICGMPSLGEKCAFCKIWHLEKPVKL